MLHWKISKVKLKLVYPMQILQEEAFEKVILEVGLTEPDALLWTHLGLIGAVKK